MCWYLHEIHCKESNHLHCDSVAHIDEVQAANRAQILNAYVMSVFAVIILCIIVTFFQKADDMSGLGVLVGICWDKAFETAYETVLEEKSINNLMAQEDDVYKLVLDYPKIAKGCVVAVGIALSIFVVLPWYWYILPHAMKEAEAHEEDMNAQQRTYDALATPYGIAQGGGWLSTQLPIRERVTDLSIGMKRSGTAGTRGELCTCCFPELLHVLLW